MTIGQVTPIAAETPMISADAESWFALHVRARHEKKVAYRLEDQGISTFLPLLSEIRRWSDRRKVVELPLFACYVFVRLRPSNSQRLRILQLDGVFGFVGTGGQAAAIPDPEIESVRTLVCQKLPWRTYPFLKIGQRVRVRSGALAGVEGILIARNGDSTLVVSIDAIHRSLAVRIEGYDVEAV